MKNKDHSEIKKSVSLTMLIIGDVILMMMIGILLTLTHFLSSMMMATLPASLLLKISTLIFSFFIALCIMALLIPKLKPGTYSLKDPRVNIWFLGFIFARIWNYEPIRHPLFAIVTLRIIFLKCMGSKISAKTALSSDTAIFDPYLLEIEEGSTIGMASYIVPHYIAKGNLVLAPVKIGKNVLIGAWATIGPGVSIGDRSTLDVGVSVLPHTVIPKDCKIQTSCIIDRSIEMAEGCTISAHTTSAKK